MLIIHAAESDHSIPGESSEVSLSVLTRESIFVHTIGDTFS